MKLEDAKPGDVLVDAYADVWRVTSDGGEFWHDSLGWVTALAVTVEGCAPFRPATARDLERIPVEQRPVLRPVSAAPMLRVRAADAKPGWVLRDQWGVLWTRTDSGLDRLTTNNAIPAYCSLCYAETLGALVFIGDLSPSDALDAIHDDLIANEMRREPRFNAADLLDEYRRLAGDQETRSFRHLKAEIEAQRAIIAEYRRLAAAIGAVAHERALTPTELAALGRKPLAPADPLGWEIER